MTAPTASAWIAIAAFTERLVARLSTLSKADEERMASGLSDKIDDLHGKAVMGRAEWEVLLLQKQVRPLLKFCVGMRGELLADSLTASLALGVSDCSS